MDVVTLQVGIPWSGVIVGYVWELEPGINDRGKRLELTMD